MNKNKFSVATGFIGADDDGGQRFSLDLDDSFWARITAFDGVSKYDWEEQYPDANGTFFTPNTARTGTASVDPAYEINSASVIIGSVVRMYRGYYAGPEQDYLFDASSGGSGSGTMTIIGGTASGFPARLLTSSGTSYGYQESLWSDFGNWIDYPGGRSGTYLVDPAAEFNLTTGIPADTEVYMQMPIPVLVFQQVQAGNGTSVNNIQSLIVGNSSGGSFTIVFDNTGSNPQTTGALTYGDSAATVETAMEALSNLTNCSVVGLGTSASPYSFTFLDSFDTYPLMTGSASLLQPTNQPRFCYEKTTSTSPTLLLENYADVWTRTLPAYTRTGNNYLADANGALPAIDGVTPFVGMIILLDRLYDSGGHVDNGILELLTVGSAGTPWTARRLPNFADTATVRPGSPVQVLSGTLYADTFWALATDGPITVNTTALWFIKQGQSIPIPSPATYFDAGVTLGGTLGNTVAGLEFKSLTNLNSNSFTTSAVLSTDNDATVPGVVLPGRIHLEEYVQLVVDGDNKLSVQLPDATHVLVEYDGGGVDPAVVWHGARRGIYGSTPKYDEIKLIYNMGEDLGLFRHDSSSAVAGERFYTSTTTDLPHPTGTWVKAVYSQQFNRWLVQALESPLVIIPLEMPADGILRPLPLRDPLIRLIDPMVPGNQVIRGIVPQMVDFPYPSPFRQRLTIYNATTGTIQVTNEDPAPSGPERIWTTGGRPIYVETGGEIPADYDSTDERWRCGLQQLSYTINAGGGSGYSTTGSLNLFDLGCGLQTTGSTTISFKAADVVDGSYGLTTMGSCGIVAKLGCGMTFGTNGSLNVAASDIASGTLGGIVSGSGCTLAIDTTPATTYTLTYVSAVDLTLTGCTLELGKTLTSTRLVRNARGVVIGIADGGSVSSTDQAVICACDCTGCIEVGGCSIPRTFDFPVSYSTASTSPPNDPDVVGCSVVSFGVTLTVVYNDIEEWWYGTCYLPDVDTTIEFWMRYNGTYWEAKFEGSRGHYTGGGDWFDITDGISCPDPVIISIYSAGGDVGGAAEGTTWLLSDVVGCYFNVYLSTFFDACGG